MSPTQAKDQMGRPYAAGYSDDDGGSTASMQSALERFESADTAGGAMLAGILSSQLDLTGETEQMAPVPRALPTSAVRHRINIAFDACLKAIEVASNSPDDIFERANALSDLCDCLEELWEYRSFREDPFRDLINTLQCLLLDAAPESISSQQLEGIKRVIGSCARSDPLTYRDISGFVTILRRAGCHVFRELS